VPDIEDAGPVTVGLGGEDPALLVDRESHRIREERLRGPEIHLQSRRQFELPDACRAFTRGGCQDGLRRPVIRNQRLVGTGGDDGLLDFDVRRGSQWGGGQGKDNGDMTRIQHAEHAL
jgi:hypothetical protein